ncbi:putative mitochondrial protein, partial [Mucuna pruriens]
MNDEIHAIENNEIECTKHSTILMEKLITLKLCWLQRVFALVARLDTINMIVFLLPQNNDIFIPRKKIYRWSFGKVQDEKSKSNFHNQLKLTKESECKMANTTQYESLIRSLRYLSATRLDIVFEVNLHSRFLEEPCVCHVQGVKRIIKGILIDEIFYANNNYVKRVGFTNIDWARCVETKKAHQVSWSLMKQPIIALLIIKHNIWQQLVVHLCYTSSMIEKNFISDALEI